MFLTIYKGNNSMNGRVELVRKLGVSIDRNDLDIVYKSHDVVDAVTGADFLSGNCIPIPQNMKQLAVPPTNQYD